METDRLAGGQPLSRGRGDGASDGVAEAVAGMWAPKENRRCKGGEGGSCGCALRFFIQAGIG